MNIKGKDRFQIQMHCLNDYIAEDNHVRVVDALVDALDLNKLGFFKEIPMRDAHQHDVGGRPCFMPADLLKLYVYGYYNRIRSSRMLERECTRNIELQWLIGGITPNYHTIADFRKDHRKSLKGVFKSFVQFLYQNDLIGGDNVGIDGTKVRAVNAKKNNYNAGKVERQQQYIESKTEQYLKQLDAADGQKDTTTSIEIKKEALQKKLATLAGRKQFYESMARLVAASEDGQVSTTDDQSRSMSLHQNQVEVAYNIQCATDDKHCLIIHYDATNQSDLKALHAMAQGAKEALNKSAEQSITVLADKGYHSGDQLQQCEQANITTLVPPHDVAQRSQIPARDYLGDKFIYDKQTDTYTCPQGETLSTSGSWYEKGHRSTGKHATYLAKQYKTKACKACPVKHLCTTSANGRLIDRSQYQESVDSNNARVIDQKQRYLLRKQIVEHPFGTIKRPWNYHYTLMKGKEKVNAEYGIIFTVYNLRRTVTILGVKELITRLKEFKKTLLKLFNPVMFRKMSGHKNFFIAIGPTIGTYRNLLKLQVAFFTIWRLSAKITELQCG